jgi:hypothetical protein
LVEVGNRTVPTGVAISTEERLYVRGHADDVAGQAFLEFFAFAWVAEVAL